MISSLVVYFPCGQRKDLKRRGRELDLVGILKELTQAPGISGHEGYAGDVLMKWIRPFCDEVRMDRSGNVIGVKKGESGGGSVMIAAHLDEIGLMITKIEKGGYLRFTTVGGVDISILPGQGVRVFGKEEVMGVITSKPPHLQGGEEANQPFKLTDLYIDTGLPEDRVSELISVGDLVKLDGELIELSGGCIAAGALDDRAGVAAMVETLERLTRRRHGFDVYAVATSREEVGGIGAATSSFSIEPDMAVVIDVTIGLSPAVPGRRGFELGKGPVIGIGPNFHPKISGRLIDLAKELDIPYQVEPVPQPGGTDAYWIQVAREGIPTGLLSIPLRNMHTTVEVCKLEDIRRLSLLLSEFIASDLMSLKEGLRCFL
jgi:putative aminopeptidase FrvX